jgi:hypothetical protein
MTREEEVTEWARRGGMTLVLQNAHTPEYWVLRDPRGTPVAQGSIEAVALWWAEEEKIHGKQAED